MKYKATYADNRFACKPINPQTNTKDHFANDLVLLTLKPKGTYAFLLAVLRFSFP